MTTSRYRFEPEEHLPQLRAVLGELSALDAISALDLDRAIRRHPKADGAVFSKSELIRGHRWLARREGGGEPPGLFAERLRKKPVRTLSGVATVTVLTQPWPCPGRCIFCPNDVRMPKSYVSSEPGCQRAAQHSFDPYLQTWFRLRALRDNGHRVDKVELIVLGGTWSFYPEAYQLWFIRRCFEALNDFGRAPDPADIRPADGPDFDGFPDPLDGIALGTGSLGTGALGTGWLGYGALGDGERNHGERGTSYNRSVAEALRRQPGGGLPAEPAGATASDLATAWRALEAAHRRNETSVARCVGLVLETRPDHLDPGEVLRLRRLGATKVQIGFQSLSDRVLELNRRGHDVAATRRAVGLLRRAGFKLHAHWMPNLYGSSPERDLEDFDRIFGDPALCPDELKIYPCSLLESAELMQVYRAGLWRPYNDEELTEVLVGCLERVPPWCRVTRVIRDIPSQEIVTGNRRTNFRQLAEDELRRRGGRCRDIRAREVRGRAVDPSTLTLRSHEYATSVGQEIFLEMIDDEERIAAFLRLSLPTSPAPAAELDGAAIIREVHVYGALASLGEPAAEPQEVASPPPPARAQHQGLGRRLVAEAERRAASAGHPSLAVISAIGTRAYYRSLGFTDGDLYQHRRLTL